MIKHPTDLMRDPKGKLKKKFFSGRTTKRGGGGKLPLTTKLINTFFHQRKKIYEKKYEPLGL